MRSPGGSELDAGRQQEGIAFEAVLDAEGAFAGQGWGHWKRTGRQGHECTFHHGGDPRLATTEATAACAVMRCRFAPWRSAARIATALPITLPRRPCAFRPLRRRR